MANEALQIAEKTEQNPQRLYDLNERFDKIQQLLRKHGVNTCQDLLDIETNLKNQISSTEALEQLIANLNEEQKSLRLKIRISS